MTAILKLCFQAQGTDHANGLCAFPSVDANRNRYPLAMGVTLCETHRVCPKSGMTLIPVRE